MNGVPAPFVGQTRFPRSSLFWFRLTFGIWTACFLMIGSVPYLTGAQPPISAILIWTSISMASAILISVALGKWVAYLERRHWALQVLLLSIAAIGAALVQSFLDHQAWMRFLKPAGPFQGHMIEAIGVNFIVYIWIFGFYISVVKLFLVVREARERDKEMARVRTAASRAELAALRYQVQPDVLFATLESASGMVKADRDKEAGALVDRLAGFMRGHLAGNTEQGATIGAELEAVDDYIVLERTRTGMVIELEIDCPEAVEALPGTTFLLQPAVETRLRHAERLGCTAVRLQLFVQRRSERLLIEMTDDAPPQERAELAGLEDRLNLIGGDDAAALRVSRKDGLFILRFDLPLQ